MVQEFNKKSEGEKTPSVKVFKCGVFYNNNKHTLIKSRKKWIPRRYSPINQE